MSTTTVVPTQDLLTFSSLLSFLLRGTADPRPISTHVRHTSYTQNMHAVMMRDIYKHSCDICLLSERCLTWSTWPVAMVQYRWQIRSTTNHEKTFAASMAAVLVLHCAPRARPARGSLHWRALALCPKTKQCRFRYNGLFSVNPMGFYCFLIRFCTCRRAAARLARFGLHGRV